MPPSAGQVDGGFSLGGRVSRAASDCSLPYCITLSADIICITVQPELCNIPDCVKLELALAVSHQGFLYIHVSLSLITLPAK